MHTTHRLRIATRIHFALLRHYDENVDVGVLLACGSAAREALWVCDASGDAELAALARQFREAAEPKTRSPAAQETPGSHRPSGFGATAFGTTTFGSTGFGATTFGATGPGGLTELPAPAPRPSMFGRLGLRPLR